MNYLTNYYKNLCEQLQNKINFLEKTLNENLNVELNKLEYPEELADSDAVIGEPPTESPGTGRRPSRPNPKEPKKPKEGASKYDWDEYYRALKAYEKWKELCGTGGGSCDRVWVYPFADPRDQTRPQPTWMKGDQYIDGNGVLWKRDGNGKWVKV